MKKRTLIYWACCLILIIGIGGAIMYLVKSSPKSGTLYVNCKEITSENVKIYSDYADLPFTEVLKALGINVEWVDNSTAEFLCNGKKYTLNLAEVTLKRDGSFKNALIPAPGSTFSHRIVLEKEIVLDSNLILDIAHSIKKRIRISIDHQKSIVYITEPED